MMDIPFEIVKNKKVENSLTIDLDRHTVFAIPGHILIGVTSAASKVNKLKDHYNKAFMSNDPKEAYFRYFVSQVLEEAKKAGTIVLRANHRYGAIQMQAFEEFVKENYETISLLSGYVLDGAEQRAGADIQPDESGIPSVTHNGIKLNGNGLERLTKDDLDQITKLMKELPSGDEVQDVEIKEMKND